MKALLSQLSFSLTEKELQSFEIRGTPDANPRKPKCNQAAGLIPAQISNDPYIDKERPYKPRWLKKAVRLKSVDLRVKLSIKAGGHPA